MYFAGRFQPRFENSQPINARPLVSRPLPADDPVQRCPDITRARTMLDWQPTVKLEDGLARTIAYFERTLTRAGRPAAGR